jgi:hypothetical protein
MAEHPSRVPKGLTYKVHLPGGQQRLAEMILFISEECENAPRFGLTKLNKIIWRADFSAFASRRVPVTGRAYQRLPMGPAPVEMRPLLGDMRNRGDLEIQPFDFGNGIIEQRVIALSIPNLRFFSEDDLEFVRDAIRYYWDKSGREASDDSHRIAWETREDGDPMPYELALLSDEDLTSEQRQRFGQMARERSWVSQ